jgi:peptidoglycan/xylan/chitin deacetylase (PgdA/CDA1 family)
MVSWPGGAKVAVLVTVAYELWSQGRWPVYSPMVTSWPISPEVSDEHSISWSQYGARAGVWRLLDVLAEHDVPATFVTSALAVEQFPDSVLAIRRAGHEVAGHSMSQDVLMPYLDRDAERANLLRCHDAFAQLTGVRPVGWCSPRATATADTAVLLAEDGCIWSGDHNDADLPYVIDTPAGPIVAIMHSDFTDVRGAAAGPRSFRDVHCDTLDYLLTTPGPEILNITIHAHVGGRPQLATMFSQILAHVRAAGPSVWVATHQQAAAWILEQDRTSRPSSAD